MKFDTPATTNPIDQLKVVGKPTDRIDGPLKTTGTAPYAYERHDVAPERRLRLRRRRRHRQGPHRLDGPARGARPRPACSPSSPPRTPASSARASCNTAKLLGGPEIEHYHQAIALVVAETFEQARAAAQLVRVDYAALDRARSTSRRRRTRRRCRSRSTSAARRKPPSATSPAPSPPRRCSSTRPTPRPTSRTR